MDIDDGDDFYSDEKATPPQETEEPRPPQAETKAEVKSPKAEGSAENGDEEEEEVEEEVEEDDDSDIEIVTERKDGTKAAAAPTAKYNEIRNIAQRTASDEITKKPVASKKDPASETAEPVVGGELPVERTSSVDVDAKPIYKPARKPITQVDIDRDLPEDNEKPWRRPGTDISDYFNYGFDEFTWALYAQKQESLRSEFDQSKIADNQKKMMEDMSMMMGMGGMPGMHGMPTAASGMGMPGMPGMGGDMAPEMQAMMQQMMAGGMDPSQMDPSMFGGGMPGQGGASGVGNPQGGNPNAGFGGQQQFGQGNQQGYNYDQQMGGMGGTDGGQPQGGGGGDVGGGGGGRGNRGNFRGRGRGRGHRGGHGW